MYYNHYRYRGKKSPGAILGEICWWSKHMFEDDESEDEEVAEDTDLSY